MRTRALNSTKSRSRITVAASMAFALVVVLPLEARAHHDEIVDKLARGETDLVTVSSSGKQGDGHSGGTGSGGGCGAGSNSFSASDNGRFVAFESYAGNLHRSDANGTLVVDVFVFDRKKRKLDLVSVMPHGLAPEVPAGLPQDVCVPRHQLGSISPTVSGTGRYVAFVSNLPLTGTDKHYLASVDPPWRVFVRDLKRQRTELVSRTSEGDPVTVPRGEIPDISDNGRAVVFNTGVAGVTEEPCPNASIAGVEVPLISELDCGIQAYVRDRKKDEILLASRSNSGEFSNQSVGPAFISGNGRYVAFATDADNLLGSEPGEPCAPVDPLNPVQVCHNVFVHDLRTRNTELISVARDGTAADGSRLPTYSSSRKPQVLSDNGRFVVFYSDSDEVVPTNPSPPRGSRAFVRDRTTGRTERVSVSSTGAILAHSNAHDFSITDDGRHVLFPTNTQGACLFALCDRAHDGTGNFLNDRRTGQTDWLTWTGPFVDGAPDPGPPGAKAAFPQIGGNGRFFIFSAGDEPPRAQGDDNRFTDVFVRDLPPPSTGAGLLSSAKRASRSGTARGVNLTDAVGDAAGAPGADLIGARVIERPELDDLYIKIDLQRLQTTRLLAGGTPLLYGLELTLEGRAYEVRVAPGSLTSPLDPVFGFFSCEATCEEVATLKGGFGTVGENVVVSLPLHVLDAERGEALEDLRAFSAYGTYEAGALTILDEAQEQ